MVFVGSNWYACLMIFVHASSTASAILLTSSSLNPNERAAAETNSRTAINRSVRLSICMLPSFTVHFGLSKNRLIASFSSLNISYRSGNPSRSNTLYTFGDMFVSLMSPMFCRTSSMNAMNTPRPALLM